MNFQTERISFLKPLILREQRLKSTWLIRRSVWISIPLHQRRSRITLPAQNKAELFINFAFNLLIKK